MTWSSEDGGPTRQATTTGGLGLSSGTARLEVTTRTVLATTMAVTAPATGAMFLLQHTAGDGATASVERIDPRTLACLATSGPLPGGPVWPGGLAVTGDGSVVTVFGNHAHRLDPDDLRVLARQRLPHDRPYNSFVTLPDGHLVTKDFGGSRPGHAVAPADRRPCELVVLDPLDLTIVARLDFPEPSIARLSADGDDVYVVGDSSLRRARWDGASLHLDPDFIATYRIRDGQTFGWDGVLAAGFAWFLDNGDGSHTFTGTLRGHGTSTAPLHLVRVDLSTAEVASAEVCSLPGGLVANPPIVDEARGIAVGYDSGNGVLCGFDVESLERRWSRRQDHASHLLLYADTGELVTGDHADVVVLDVATGTELARVDSGLGMQSVLFPTPGPAGDFYVCAFPGISRVAVAP